MPGTLDITVADFDRDSLHTLPLAIIPLETPALKHARLVKNARLDCVVELFGDAHTGSGQIDIEALPKALGWPDQAVRSDLCILRKLSKLPSFDVYSLRVQLREHGIPVNDHDALRLSAYTNQQLTNYMSAFTRPLILKIYGDDDMAIGSFEDLVSLFRQPDAKKALEKLKIMASKLEVNVEDVPRFLEDYGDIFLSLSYFRRGYDFVQPLIADFLIWLDEFSRSWLVRQNAQMTTACRAIQDIFNDTLATLSSRFGNFDRHTRDLWDNVSASRFREVETLIRSYHTAIGGVLCTLTVKMEAWRRAFPTNGAGGPQMRAEFIMSEIRQGLDTIAAIQRSAPELADLR